MKPEEEILQSMCLYGKISQEHADEIRKIIKQALQKQKEKIIEGLPKQVAPNCPCCKTKTKLQCEGWNSCLEEVIKSINKI
jgi:hypothetical protein